MDEIRVRHAKSVGRAHLLAGKNRQDAMKTDKVVLSDKTVFYGVICDGCSEGENSEVGANLAVSFLCRQIEILVKSRVSANKIPGILHKRLLAFLKALLGNITFDSPVSRVNYIKHNLLFTILGFVYSDGESVIFAQGDGTYIVNDVVTTREENDMPRYISYSLVDRKYLSSSASALPENFDVYPIDSANLYNLAIASDAISEEPEFLKELWGHKQPIGLQRRVNVWSLVDHKFQDDLSVITLEKVDTGLVEFVLPEMNF